RHPAAVEDRRRERRVLPPFGLHQPEHGSGAALAARHVDVGRAGLLQREPHELAAPLNFRPIVKLVAHRRPPSIFQHSILVGPLLAPSLSPANGWRGRASVKSATICKLLRCPPLPFVSAGAESATICKRPQRPGGPPPR